MWPRITKQLFYVPSNILCRTVKSGNPRVRFAPSPTGYLHLGGLRTALYNYLFAKSRDGTFILRIEDTDQSRKVEGALEALVKDVEWSGIEFQEGPTKGGNYGPYVQSERLEIYQDYIRRLLDNGSAYHCFCTERRLNILRRDAARSQRIPKYDNRCRNLTQEDVKEKMNAGIPSCIRFKLTSNILAFEDLVYGGISYDVSMVEGDPVLMKSDGFPTYHFANVVDDHLMAITHVLRGVEWQISTTKHLLIYRAFGWTPPQFGHLPLIVNSDGTKLSKRQHDVRVEDYRHNGIFPLALVNYITLSGGGFDHVPGEGVVLKTMDELAQESGDVQYSTLSEQICPPTAKIINQNYMRALFREKFQIRNVNSHPTRLNADLLAECNKLEIKRRLKDETLSQELITNVQTLISNKYPDQNLNVSQDHIKTVLNWALSRTSRLDELVSNKFGFLWILPVKNSAELDKKLLVRLLQNLEHLDKFDENTLKNHLRQFSLNNNVKFPVLMKMLRSALSGLNEGPGVAEMMHLLGKGQSLERIKAVLR